MFKPVKLLGEVMALAYLVNANTEYCTMIRYAGHVDLIKIQVFPNKENCTEDKPVYGADFYVDGKHGDDSEKLFIDLKSTLESYLYPDIKEEVPCTN